MNIKQTAAAIRANTIDIANCTNATRLVRLHDKRWDLTARYSMLLRVAGISAA